jgi:hypothetical protein
VPFEPVDLFVDSAGGAWYGDNAGYRVVCYKQFVSNTPDGTASFLQPGLTAAYPESITQDSSGALWIAGDAVGGYHYKAGFAVVPLSGECHPGTPSYAIYTYSGYGGSAPGLYSIAPQSGQAGIWTQDYDRQQLFQVNSTSETPTVNPIAVAGLFFLGLNKAATGTIYALTTNYTTAINLQTLSTNGTLTPIATIPYSYVYPVPFALTPALRVAYTESDVPGIGLFDQPSGESMVLPMPVTPLLKENSQGSCAGQAFDATDTPWMLCGRSDRSVAAYRVLLTPTWSVFPSSTVAIDIESYCTYTYTLGIGEQFPQSSAPFAMKSSDTSIVSPIGPATGNPHVLTLKVSAKVGTAIVTISDKNKRAVDVTFNVTVDSGGVQCGIGRRPHRSRTMVALP